MMHTFTLSVKLDEIVSPYKNSLLQEIRQSNLAIRHGNFTDNGFVRYMGNLADVTLSLDYMLDELLPLDSFVAIGIDQAHKHLTIRGTGYKRHIFTPDLYFSNGRVAIADIVCQTISQEG